MANVMGPMSAPSGIRKRMFAMGTAADAVAAAPAGMAAMPGRGSAGTATLALAVPGSRASSGQAAEA
eukprot:CAMPEP_0197591924 /NCGR_PEP_ID=MMETSP1326-20131121/14098_1 /TAXON_ID=1155430 /ORGANISM="Genus nov. species nov., Strain RCC2288" /LENGTH=66 /DNA_ID=CAMNT_0043157507 /DNA_START=422 /DNA_END=622 /DNA_ORIENTATION=+